MKLKIEICEKKFAGTYLAIFIVGLVNCIEKGHLSIEESERLLFGPGLIEKLQDFLPEISELIHKGTELEDIKSLIPHQLSNVLSAIKNESYSSIDIKDIRGVKVFYSIED